MTIFLTSVDNPYSDEVGGKHTHLLLLEKGLKEIGCGVEYFYPRPPIDKLKNFAEGNNKNIKPIKNFLKNSVFYLFFLIKKNNEKLSLIKDFLEEHNQFDVCNAHDVVALLAVRKFKGKKVLTLHGYYARELISDIKNPILRFFLFNYAFSLERRAIRIADSIIAVDDRIKEYLIAKFKYNPSDIHVVFNAVDTDAFSPISLDKQYKNRSKLGFSSQDFIALIPRRLVKKNVVIYAVQALGKIVDRRIKIIVIGDGPEMDALKAYAQEDRRLALLGLVPHKKINSYYLISDVVIVPSITTDGIQEATSISMLEGMSCGKVVICSKIGGMEQVINSGVNGILVEEKNSTAIATAITSLKDDVEKRASIAKNAREYVLKFHSYKKHAETILGVYMG